MRTFQIILFFLLTGSVIQLSAQTDFQVRERTATLSVGERSGYTITIEGMSERDIVKALKGWLAEKQKKPEFEETGKHELMVNDMEIPQLSQTPVDIYYLFEESKDNIQVTGFFVVGDAFVSSTTNPEKFKECIVLMRNFGMRTEKIKIMDKMNAAEKELEKRQDEQQQLEKEKIQMNDQITECTQTIEKAKSGLDENAKEQDTKKSEIASQQSTLDGIKQELSKYEDY